MQRMTLVMTHDCNLDCRYCLQKHENVCMPEETARQAIDNLCTMLRKTPAEHRASSRAKVQISFYGGEPLLEKEKIKNLVRYANRSVGEECGYDVSYEITTNGLLLESDFIRFAKDNHIILALSHDGLAQDPVRQDRGGHPTRARVDEKLKLLLSAFPDTIIMMTVHPDHAGCVSGSVNFFYEAGVRSVSLVPAHGDRVNWTQEKFDELSRQMEIVKKLYVKWNQGNGYFRVIPFENKIRNYILQKDADSALCHFGCHKIMVDTDGRYYPCNHFIGQDGYSIGSLRDDIDEEKIASLEKERVEPGICRDCALRMRCRHTCACANHGHTGSMAKVSALQCEYEKLIIRLADEAASELIREENPRYVERMYRE